MGNTHSEICVDVEKVPFSSLQHIFTFYTKYLLTAMFKTAISVEQIDRMAVSFVLKNKNQNILSQGHNYAMKERDYGGRH